MNDLIKYHDSDQVIEQNVVSFDSPHESFDDNTSNLMQGILRRWPIVFLVFILICAIGIPAVWFLVEPIYTVTGAIKVEPVLENILTGQGDKGLISNYQTFMNTQAILITSNQIVQGAADYLVDKNLSFFKGEPTNPVMKIKQKIMDTSKSPDFAVILKQAISNEIITVAPANRTELITITMKSSEPKEAQQIVDAFLDSYMDVERRGLTSEQGSRLEQLRTEKQKLDKTIKNHREKIRELAEEFGPSTTVDSKEVIQQRKRIPFLYAELARLESRKINLETQVTLLENYPEQGLEPEEMIRIRNEYINSNPSVQELTRNIIQLERELIIAQQNLSVENPVLRQKQELIDAFQLRLEEKREEAAKEFDLMASKEAANASIVKQRTAKAELNQTIMYIERLNKELEDADIEMLTVNSKQLDIQDYQFEFERDKNMYDKVIRRIQELEMELNRRPRIGIFSKAEIGPVVDKRMKYILAVLFGALASGVLLASLVNKWDF